MEITEKKFCSPKRRDSSSRLAQEKNFLLEELALRSNCEKHVVITKSYPDHPDFRLWFTKAAKAAKIADQTCHKAQGLLDMTENC